MRTKRKGSHSNWKSQLEEAHEQIRREGNTPLAPSPEDMIRQFRDGYLPGSTSIEPISPGSESRRTMDKVMSATEARVHFGEVMRRVNERDEVIVVERDGSPMIAIMSVEQLNRLREGQQAGEERDWYDLAMEARELVRQARDNQPAPDIDQLFHDMMEERDAQLIANPRRR